jgi:hypothetical protein
MLDEGGAKGLCGRVRTGRDQREKVLGGVTVQGRLRWRGGGREELKGAGGVHSVRSQMCRAQEFT